MQLSLADAVVVPGTGNSAAAGRMALLFLTQFRSVEANFRTIIPTFSDRPLSQPISQTTILRRTACQMTAVDGAAFKDEITAVWKSSRKALPTAFHSFIGEKTPFS